MLQAVTGPLEAAPAFVMNALSTKKLLSIRRVVAEVAKEMFKTPVPAVFRSCFFNPNVLFFITLVLPHLMFGPKNRT
jgi:hypothetical protein